jgi:Fe-S-cluster containining protein
MSPDRFGMLYLRRVRRRLSLLELPNGDCIFYRDGCLIYTCRPEQCRTFPFWEEFLRTPEAWSRLKGECPGAGTGELYRFEAIETLRFNPRRRGRAGRERTGRGQAGERANGAGGERPETET